MCTGGQPLSHSAVLVVAYVSFARGLGWLTWDQETIADWDLVVGKEGCRGVLQQGNQPAACVTLSLSLLLPLSLSLYLHACLVRRNNDKEQNVPSIAARCSNAAAFLTALLWLEAISEQTYPRFFLSRVGTCLEWTRHC